MRPDRHLKALGAVPGVCALHGTVMRGLITEVDRMSSLTKRMSTKKTNTTTNPCTQVATKWAISQATDR
jgi:hypothetical protein